MQLVLFKVETACRLGYTKPSWTSLPCVWNQTFSVKVISIRIVCMWCALLDWCIVPTGMCMRLSSVCVCVDARCKDLYSCFMFHAYWLQILRHCHSQAHLQRLSPYFLPGKGVWWQTTEERCKFLDGTAEPVERCEGVASRRLLSYKSKGYEY